MTITNIIADLTAAADELQVEIDRMIDEHGAIGRALAALSGHTVTVAVTGPTPHVATIVAAAPTPAAAPAKVKPPTQRRPRKGAIDMQAVAKWIIDAKAAGTYSLKALAVAFDRPESAVKNWPKTCRDSGLLDIAAPAPVTSPVVTTIVDHIASTTSTANKPMIAKHPHVLACTEDDCGAEFATDKGHELHRHCLNTHARRPYNYERTPVVTAGAA